MFKVSDAGDVAFLALMGAMLAGIALFMVVALGQAGVL